MPTVRAFASGNHRGLILDPDYRTADERALANRDGRLSDWDPSPCDECQNRTRCARDRLSCTAFNAWTEHGRNPPDSERVPTHVHYIRIIPTTPRACRECGKTFAHEKAIGRAHQGTSVCPDCSTRQC